MRYPAYILFLLTLIIPLSSAAENDDLCKRSTEGTEFWFGFMESRNYSPNHYLEVTVTARETTTFQIFIGKGGIPYGGPYTVNANTSSQVVIPWEMVEATDSEEIQDRGIRLISEKPVNLYALNYSRNSADVAVIYPVESLGNEYFAMCYHPHIHESNGNYGNGRNSQFLVVAAFDGTKVKIVPSVRTHKLVDAGDTITVVLNKGEVYQVQSMNRNNLPGQGDLTGSYILSDKPVAFYSGSLSTTVPADPGSSAWDHLYEQIPPVYSWGREYYTVPLKSREQDRYRIMAALDNTVVYVEGQLPLIINRGEYKEFVLYHNEPKRISSQKPILVAQYSQSQSVDRAYTQGNGDPFMIILSPVSQTKSDVTFVAYDSQEIKKYFANVITLTEETGNILLDGSSIQSQFTPFSNSNYSWAQLTLVPGTYRLHSTNPDRGFLAYVYGFGGVESYGYGVGFNLNLVLDLGKSIYFKGDTLLLCYGDTLTLDAGPYFDNYLWSDGSTGQKLNVTEGGTYSVVASTLDGCILEDRKTVFVSHPVADLGLDHDEGCFPYSVQLSGGSGFEQYIWQNETGDTLSQAPAYTASLTGKYLLTAYDKYRCAVQDSMTLTVFPVPSVSLSGTSLVCGSRTSSVEADIQGTDQSIWDQGSFRWESSQPGKLSFRNQTFTSAEFEVNEWGKYEIWYTLTTVDGCEVKDTLTVSLFQTPTSEFTFTDNPADKCKGYSREILYTGNASQNALFSWDYGGSTLVETTDWQRSRVSVGAFNSNPFISLHVEENGCYSDTTRKAIGANPDFVMNTVKSRGCDSATIYFSGQLNVPDDLLFEWDFGDGSPVSHQQNTSHFYSSTGHYSVSLQITNRLNGCKIGFEVEDMVKIFATPVAEISVDPSLCHTDTIPAYFTNSIDSSFCMWTFTGARQYGQGNDSIQVILDQPVSVIGLQVDEYGCLSRKVETTLKRKPDFDITSSLEEGCQPLGVTFGISDADAYLNFSWTVDSVTASGTELALNLGKPGYTDVTVAAYSSETGCRDTLTKTGMIRVHPKPTAGFAVDYPVAILKQSNLSFTNESLLADNFTWDFGDGTGSSEVSPRHNYTRMGNFLVTLLAETDFGCRDTADMDINILPFDVHTPNAFRPDSDIPENRTFMPITLGVAPENFHLQVFGRWGQLVFESASLDEHWDGKLPGGRKAPAGNYIWKAEYTDIQGYRHRQTGQVLLVR